MPMQISDHISELLFDHECVVVPGFGAFLTRYFPAEVNTATHMMRPPGKRVYFNASIRENDGLLAKAISFNSNISYELALQRLDETRHQWMQEIEAGKKLNLQGIGKLYRDEVSGTLQFSPSLENNYLPESYGLSIFRSPAIQREEQIKKDIQRSIEKHVGKSKKRQSKGMPWAAVLGPVIFASALGAAYFAFQPEQGYDRAAFDWFNQAEENPVVETSGAAIKSKVEEEKDLVIETPATENVTAEPKSDVEATTVEARFKIVVGAFKDDVNAEAYARQLQQMGYQASATGHQNGFNRVVIGKYAKRSDALAEINEIRRQVNPGAWIYSK